MAWRAGIGKAALLDGPTWRLAQVTPDGVVFRHPLIRAACYREEAYAERLTAHRAVLRCQAMLSEDAGQERLFEESLHTAGCAAYGVARTRLVYAEWLRRSRRRTAARRQLLLAHETFDRIGAHGWQPRVRAELTRSARPHR